MAGRSIALFLGFLGGLTILVGALVGFLLPLGTHWATGGTVGLALRLISLFVGGILGLLVLFTSRPRIFWWPGRRLFNGLVLVVLGAMTWVLLGGTLLTTAGAILTVLAGFLLPLEGFFGRGWGHRRSWFRRRWF